VGWWPKTFRPSPQLKKRCPGPPPLPLPTPLLPDQDKICDVITKDWVVNISHHFLSTIHSYVNTNTHMSIPYVYQSESPVRFVRISANGVSKESTYEDNMKLWLQKIAQAFIKLISQKWWSDNFITIVKFLARA
jgi:hypothetical protein